MNRQTIIPSTVRTASFISVIGMFCLFGDPTWAPGQEREGLPRRGGRCQEC